jgi:DNA-binding response OmpR family regulator
MHPGVSQYRFSSGRRGGERMVAASSRAGGSAAQRAIKVLVVDDDRDTVLSLRLLLSTEGYEALGVYDAQSVFDAVRDFQPDAVLLDIGMPQMTGYDIARQLRATHGKDLLLIAVTAWNKFSDRMAARIAGFDHHVSKPYQSEQILDLLRPLADSLGRL